MSRIPARPGGSAATTIPLVLDGTGQPTIVPLLIKNGRNSSGYELQITGTAPSGYILRDAGGVLRGELGIAAVNGDWATGVQANDIVLISETHSVRVRGAVAVHLSSPSNPFNLTTSGYVRLDDSVGTQMGFNASNVKADTNNVAYTVGGTGTGSHIFAHNFVKVAAAGNMAGMQLATFSVAPASGNATIRALDLAMTVNQTGGANGAVTGIYLAVTETAVGGTHDLIHLKAGAAGATTIFKVDNTGKPTFGLGSIALGGGAGATLGTIGGSGPAAAAQNKWGKINFGGTDYFVPMFI